MISLTEYMTVGEIRFNNGAPKCNTDQYKFIKSYRVPKVGVLSVFSHILFDQHYCGTLELVNGENFFYNYEYINDVKEKFIDIGKKRKVIKI